jgi:hypothetical protein
MTKEQPIPKPIGDMLIKSGKGIDLPDGRYYHYADVIGFMRAYADQETASLRNEVERLKGLLEEALLTGWNNGFDTCNPHSAKSYSPTESWQQFKTNNNI